MDRFLDRRGFLAKPGALTQALALVLSLLGSSCTRFAVAQHVVPHDPVKIGSLIKLTHPESVGWDIENGIAIDMEINDDHTVCILGTGSKPRKFVVRCQAIKKLDNGSLIPHTVARHVFTIVADGPTPTPTPTPTPGPTPTPEPTPNVIPPEVKNELGVGHETYRLAIATGDKASSAALAGHFEAVATGLRLSVGSQAAIDAAAKTLHSETNSIFTQPKWQPVADKLSTLTNDAVNRANGFSYLGYVSLYEEIASGFKSAGR